MAEIKKSASMPLSDVLPSLKAGLDDVLSFLRFPARDQKVSAWTVPEGAAQSYSVGKRAASARKGGRAGVSRKVRAAACDSDSCDSDDDCDSCDDSCHDCYTDDGCTTCTCPT